MQPEPPRGHVPANDLAAMRAHYDIAGAEQALSDELDPALVSDGWLPLFGRWLAAAVEAAVPEPNAMVLATVDEAGNPATRTVLCKGIEPDGITFFTNYDSDKGRHLAAHPYASATFLWLPLHRQITVRGPVRRVTEEETAEYWRTRPRGSRLGAWASRQSRPVTSRADLERALVEVSREYEVGSDAIPVPPFWGGFRIHPDVVEFWQGRPDRLHDRIRMRLVDGAWSAQRLQP
ncbi:pyridoxamine 5'-phosphate oxidase [Rhodococcus coprophilus]|nr:pyridoxamine 5'-phosphate oxidase [Rhodococcus coprophilus]